MYFCVSGIVRPYERGVEPAEVVVNPTTIRSRPRRLAKIGHIEQKHFNIYLEKNNIIQ